ncbi:MAG: transposase [Gammaproteobacteria bacterium]|nr:transposase [Gammaproteobacteria bacterium]MCY4357488.1 transposase [Gammaproteobacteria bacterium]
MPCTDRRGQAKPLFQWDDVDPLSDFHRLELVLDHLPDERILTTLENKRGRGRNDYPVAAMWRAYIANIVFQHSSTESLVRELKRNKDLLSVWL